jgi:hypothetical protein
LGDSGKPEHQIHLTVTTDDNAVRTSRIAFIDLEASSLGSASFPTEIGRAIIRDDGSVASGSCLIRPPAKWTLYRNAWSVASEALTGITKAMLDRDDLPPTGVEAVPRCSGRSRPAQRRAGFRWALAWHACRRRTDLARWPSNRRRKESHRTYGADLEIGEVPVNWAEADARRSTTGIGFCRGGSVFDWSASSRSVAILTHCDFRRQAQTS